MYFFNEFSYTMRDKQISPKRLIDIFGKRESFVSPLRSPQYTSLVR